MPSSVSTSMNRSGATSRCCSKSLCPRSYADPAMDGEEAALVSRDNAMSVGRITLSL
jgi:hypothetical protein